MSERSKNVLFFNIKMNQTIQANLKLIDHLQLAKENKKINSVLLKYSSSTLKYGKSAVVSSY
jgi:hypothetical protein